MLNLTKIPSHMRYDVEQYAYDGILHGDFLKAVMENKLVEAFVHADLANASTMNSWASFLYNDLSSDAWGSPEKVAAWCKARQADVIRRKQSDDTPQ